MDENSKNLCDYSVSPKSLALLSSFLAPTRSPRNADARLFVCPFVHFKLVLSSQSSSNLQAIIQ